MVVCLCGQVSLTCPSFYGEVCFYPFITETLKPTVSSLSLVRMAGLCFFFASDDGEIDGT